MEKLLFTPFSSLNIKAIIFDLGGVILDIDYTKTLEEFKKLGIDVEKEQLVLAANNEMLNLFDCGLISPEKFREHIHNYANKPLHDYQVDNAWNALLLDWNIDRLKLLDNLRKDYSVYLLSNTSIIHSNFYNERLRKLTQGRDLRAYFDKVYYSYELGIRKPDPAIFMRVIDENNLDPQQTLFIDDTAEHVESAKKLGLNSYLIKPKQGETILELFE